MLQTLKDLFEALRPGGESEEERQHALQLAAAVLLVEVMRADAEIGAAERAAAMAALRRRFGLSEDEVARLLELAEQTSRHASDYYSFTSRINEAFEPAEKLQMIENMWRIVYADGELAAAENHVMRKISDLLYIPHDDYICAKLRAQQASPTTGST
jgi:uncharacterized tellurite resistance protein B-like protein